MIPYLHIEEITALGAGDKQIGFCRNGRSFKASKDALIILRGFSFLYIRGGGKGRRYNRRWCTEVIGEPSTIMQGDYTSYGYKLTLEYPNLKRITLEWKNSSRQIPALVIKISGLKRFHPDSLNRVYEKIENQKYKQGLRRANREKAKHLISGNLEREGDNLTATADHSVVAHILKSIAEKNCFYFTCYIRGLIKGLVMGQSPLAPS